MHDCNPTKTNTIHPCNYLQQSTMLYKRDDDYTDTFPYYVHASTKIRHTWMPHIYHATSRESQMPTTSVPQSMGAQEV